MATSTNYGWAEPDDSSLVKNGASDIRTLGNAIDTSVWNVGFGEAGKNKIINGNFGIWQRGTSFTPSTGVYTADRWFYSSDGASGATITQQTFTPATAPVAGYEGSYFVRYARTSGTTTYNQFYQPIEDVRTFAGQTVTFSFWSKADAATNISLDGYQIYGTGGSSPTGMGLSGTASLTTSWQRFTFNANVPSISGKTIGTNSLLRPMFSFGTGNKVVDIWGVQLEYGSKATPFQTASGGSPQAELAMCQRYYWRLTGNAAGYYRLADSGFANSATDAHLSIQNPVTMRVTPTSVDFSSVFLENYIGAGSKAATALTINSVSNPMVSTASITVASGLTAGTRYFGFLNNNTSSFIGYSAEL